MTVKTNDNGEFVFIDKNGKEHEIDHHSSYCESCGNTHLSFEIDDLDFESNDGYYGDWEYFDDYESLNEEIEEHLKNSPPQHIS